MRSLALIALALGLVACSSADDPVAPPTTLGTSIEAASVMVGGTPVNGGVVSGERGQTLFQIRLRDRDRLHLQSVEYCEVRFDVPGMGRQAQRRAGAQLCFDDGSNGDDTPGDGFYHFLDQSDSIGCGRAGMPNGSYDYHFRCQFADGTTSETTVTVTRQ